jgi:hypothetical protein
MYSYTHTHTHTHTHTQPSLWQYIRYFGEDLLATGEAGYWCTQFFSAVRFVHSIDDRVDAPDAMKSRRIGRSLDRTLSNASAEVEDDGTDC